MKTELRLAPHGVLPGEQVIELWYAGQFIGTVYGADGPGLRLMTRGKPGVMFEPGAPDGVRMLQIIITDLPAGRADR